jgi:hypothetical protein
VRPAMMARHLKALVESFPAFRSDLTVLVDPACVHGRAGCDAIWRRRAKAGRLAHEQQNSSEALGVRRRLE